MRKILLVLLSTSMVIEVLGINHSKRKYRTEGQERSFVKKSKLFTKEEEEESPKARDKYGNMPIHYAARNSHIGVLEWLLAHGAQINARDDDGAEPIHVAAAYGQVNALKWLIVHGSQINARDDKEERHHCFMQHVMVRVTD